MLGLLSAVAEERPLLCLVEDAQWLDAASSQVLGFVARRVLAESVAIVVAVREPASDRHARLRRPARASPRRAAREGCARAAGERASRAGSTSRVGDRIVAETRGNPLALLELPGHMTAAELAGGFELPAAGELPAHIEDHYLRRVGELPEATQRLMLLAAAEPLGDAALVWRAGRRLDIETGALAPAEAAELLEIGARVRFRHPLVRSAVYRAASLEQPAAGARSPGRGERSGRPTPIGARGTARWRQQDPTRTSPPSSSARPAARRLAAGSPPRRPSCSAPSR